MNVKVEMPAFDADELIRQDKERVWHHILQHRVYDTKEPMIIAKADGLRLEDIRGNRYLDATSGGVWCVNVGYGRDSIAEAVAQQLRVMPYYAGKLGNIPAIRLADKIIALLPGLDKVFYSNSGSEANEKAFKMIRQAAHLKKNRKIKILFRNRDYHGTTLAALSATGQPERRDDFGPLLEGFVEFPHACCYRCAFGKTYPGCNLECARAVETVILKEGPDTVGGLIVEPITAGGGVIPPVKEYYPLLQQICRKYGVVLIMDEVVCAFGRTGKMFGFQHYDVDPDIVTMAKGLASAYMPISITAVKQNIYNIFLNDPADKMAFFRDISTYGGCAGGCAAALENIRIIEEEKLCENSRLMGEYLFERLAELRALPVVGDIRGKGLFAGIELVADKAAKTPMDEARFGAILGEIAKLGVLVGATQRSLPGLNNTINLAPALIVTRAEIDEMADVLIKVLSKQS